MRSTHASVPFLKLACPFGIAATALLSSGCRPPAASPDRTPPASEDGAPAVDASSRSAPAGSASSEEEIPFNGIFLNHISKEINLKVLYLSLDGSRPQEMVDYFHSQSLRPTTTDILDVPPSEDVGPGHATYRMFSFIPDKLGLIRGFQTRVHVGALSGAVSPAQLASALFGATVLVVVAADETAAYERVLASVRASATYIPRMPIVLVLEGAASTVRPSKNPKGVVEVLQRRAGDEHTYFDSLKIAVKLGLDRMLEGRPTVKEPLRMVAAPPLIDTLRRLEAKKMRPLTEVEVREVRDQIPFMMLPESAARALDRQRGYPDIDPDMVWEQWLARRRDH